MNQDNHQSDTYSNIEDSQSYSEASNSREYLVAIAIAIIILGLDGFQETVESIPVLRDILSTSVVSIIQLIFVPLAALYLMYIVVDVAKKRLYPHIATSSIAVKKTPLWDMTHEIAPRMMVATLTGTITAIALASLDTIVIPIMSDSLRLLANYRLNILNSTIVMSYVVVLIVFFATFATRGQSTSGAEYIEHQEQLARDDYKRIMHKLNNAEIGEYTLQRGTTDRIKKIIKKDLEEYDLNGAYFDGSTTYKTLTKYSSLFATLHLRRKSLNPGDREALERAIIMIRPIRYHQLSNEKAKEIHGGDIDFLIGIIHVFEDFLNIKEIDDERNLDAMGN